MFAGPSNHLVKTTLIVAASESCWAVELSGRRFRTQTFQLIFPIPTVDNVIKIKNVTVRHNQRATIVISSLRLADWCEPFHTQPHVPLSMMSLEPFLSFGVCRIHFGWNVTNFPNFIDCVVLCVPTLALFTFSTNSPVDGSAVAGWCLAHSVHRSKAIRVKASEKTNLYFTETSRV